MIRSCSCNLLLGIIYQLIPGSKTPRMGPAKRMRRERIERFQNLSGGHPSKRSSMISSSKGGTENKLLFDASLNRDRGSLVCVVAPTYEAPC